MNSFLLSVKPFLNYISFYFALCKRNEKSPVISLFAILKVWSGSTMQKVCQGNSELDCCGKSPVLLFVF